MLSDTTFRSPDGLFQDFMHVQLGQDLKQTRPYVQVQRCSGTAILSARRQSRALAGAGGSPATAGLPGSPLHLPGDAAVAQLDMGAAESGGDGRGGGGGSGELGSLMEEGSGADSTGLADDEEFAVEAEAHRCAAATSSSQRAQCRSSKG